MDSLIDWFVRAKEPNIESSPQVLWWAGAALVSSMMNRLVWTNVRAETVDDRLFGNLFVLVVGPPGVGKTDAIKRARPIAEKIGVRLGPDDVTGERLIDFTKTFKWDDDKGDQGRADRKGGQKLSKEEVAKLKEEEGKSRGTLALFLNEFDHLFHSGSAVALKRVLTDFYDCRNESYIRETYTRGRQQVDQMCMTLIGAATPAHMAEVFSRNEWQEGLPSRFIYVWAGDELSMKDEFGRDDEADRELTRAVHAVSRFVLDHQKIGWEPDASEARRAWRKDAAKAGPVHPLLVGYNTRRYVSACKLAMVRAVSRCSRKIALIDWLESVARIQEAERDIHKALAQAGGNELRAVMVWAADWVRRVGWVDEAALRRKLGQTVQPQLVSPVLDEMGRSKMIEFTGEPPTRVYSAGIKEHTHGEIENAGEPPKPSGAARSVAGRTRKPKR